MKRKIIQFTLYSTMLILLAVVLFWLTAPAQGDARPRYSIHLPRAPYLSYDSDSLPSFERPICWQEATGYCEPFADDFYMIYGVVDWKDETLGGIYLSGDGCFIFMFYANAEHPYIAQWFTECPYYDASEMSPN